MQSIDDISTVVDERFDLFLLNLPLVFFDSWVEGFFHVFDLFLHQRLLHGVQAGNYIIIVFDYEFQINDLLSVRLSFLENLFGCVRDLDTKQFQVFHFFQETD